MKKVIRSLLLAILAVVILLAAFIGWRGYEGYRNITASASVEQMVETIESSDTFVPYDQLPSCLLEATVAIEDHRFYEHGAIDYIGLLRALASQILPGMLESGGSTITQQTVKNMYGLFQSSIDRKAAEIFLASELEKICTKDEILALYVNIINYGDSYTGIYEASCGYFGVYPSYLSDAQCTILAGIPQSPSNLQLSNHYDAAKKKQLLVLDAMVENDYITQSEADTIYASSIW